MVLLDRSCCCVKIQTGAIVVGSSVILWNICVILVLCLVQHNDNFFMKWFENPKFILIDKGELDMKIVILAIQSVESIVCLTMIIGVFISFKWLLLPYMIFEGLYLIGQLFMAAFCFFYSWVHGLMFLIGIGE